MINTAFQQRYMHSQLMHCLLLLLLLLTKSGGTGNNAVFAMHVRTNDHLAKMPGAGGGGAGGGGSLLFSNNNNNNNYYPSSNRHPKWNGRRNYHHPSNNNESLYVLPIPEGPFELSKDWDIDMPKKSAFAGFDAPNDLKRWRIACLQAQRGEQILLSNVLKVIGSSFDPVQFDQYYKDIHRIADWQSSSDENTLKTLKSIPNFADTTDKLHSHRKAPIIQFGYNVFNAKNFEGTYNHTHGFGITQLMTGDNGKPIKMPIPLVAVGSFDMNWGWLSTNFLNRTTYWGATLNFNSVRNPYKKGWKYVQEEVQEFLDDPNLVMVLVTQHHNITHPKVLSIPLGINNRKNTWHMMKRVEIRGMKKNQLVLYAMSNNVFRPIILECIRSKMDSDSLYANPHKSDGNIDLAQLHYLTAMGHSRAVFCPSGMGSDTFRAWETLTMGSMPIVERGFGLERSFYKLPVLILDDFHDISTLIVKQAYVEALYRAEEWEYERLTMRYWQNLLTEVSYSGKIDYMLERHPMHAQDVGFTRPLVPFNCNKGCGVGTKRTPSKYCAIDESLLSEEYFSKYLS